MINVAQSAAFEAVYESGQAGLVPGLEIAIEDNDGNTVYGPTTAGIAELLVGGQPSGTYAAQVPAAPAATGQYTILWSNDGSFDPQAGGAADDLIVLTAAEAAGSLPAIPGDGEGGALWGPCTSWVTVDEVDDFCELPETSNPIELIPLLERSAASASQFLWAASGRQFSGLCQRTVRPCRTDCVCNWQVLSRGYVVMPHWLGTTWSCGDLNPCGCEAVSEVKLAGYPVREIVQVLIDGLVIAPSEYELREYRYLIRMNGARWPSCQSMDVVDDSEGAFAVTYTFGQTPPQMGRDAAAQLACEIFKASQDLECVLPAGARRITRQGITIDTTYFTRDADGTWRTGLPFVDAFLTAANPAGLIRRPTVWAPGRRYSRGSAA